MLRKTISPIIYFQQIGRLLSFSNRNNNLKIVDLVNNIQNHKVIYNLYNDIYTKAKELKKIDKKMKKYIIIYWKISRLLIMLQQLIE